MNFGSEVVHFSRGHSQAQTEKVHLDRIVDQCDLVGAMGLEHYQEQQQIMVEIYFPLRPSEILNQPVRAIVLLYSISDRSTFEELNDTYQEIRDIENQRHIPTIVVGSKREGKPREVTKTEGEGLAALFRALFIEISSLSPRRRRGHHDADDAVISLLRHCPHFMINCLGQPQCNVFVFCNDIKVTNNFCKSLLEGPTFSQGPKDHNFLRAYCKIAGLPFTLNHNLSLSDAAVFSQFMQIKLSTR